MEFQTHAAAGRVSEITGEGKNGVILNYDRGQRRLGMVYGSRKYNEDFGSKNPTSVMMLERYTPGINTYIKSLEYKTLPFEYKLLNYKPEAWTPLKVCSIAQEHGADAKHRRKRHGNDQCA